MHELHKSYDDFLGFAQITPDNWLLKDRKDYVPFGISNDEWIMMFIEPKISNTVAPLVIRSFEIARACMIYSWFFYPLATLGFEQCTRVLECAARERCRMLGTESERFYDNLKTLISSGLIAANEESRWDAIRHLRNSRSHLSSFMLVDPTQSADILRTTAELINGIWSKTAPNPITEH